MKSKLFLLFLILLSISMSSTVRAQNENFMPISSTDKFNYRGYLNGNVFTSNASETISEYDGNLLLAYEYFPNLPEHLKSSITLTYNANVTHSSHLKCGSNTSMHPQYINYPEWIIGFRGFALQVLNFETNWLSEGSLGCGNPLTGSELSLLIPGYHYSDKQADDYGYLRPSNEQPPYYQNNHDMIRILMADGTIKYLFNLSSGTKTGTYVESASPDRKTYAFVENEDDDDENREMYYKMGDGFTYIFYEKPSRLWGNGGWSSSKVMYLTKIISNVGDIFTIGYDSQSGNISSFGRYLFCNIQLDRSSKGCLGQIYPSDIFQLGYNYIDFGFEDPKIAYIDLMLNEKKTSTLWLNFSDQLSYYNNDRSSEATRIIQVLGISDEKNIMTEFNYSNFQRNYCYQSYATLITKPKLITSIEYPSNKKTEIEYYQEKFSGSYPNLSLDLIPTSDIDVICIDYNMTYAFRDCFTNYMVKKKKIYNASNLINEQNYSYSFDGIFNDPLMRENYVPGIKTSINSINYQSANSIPGETQQTFYYSRYRSGYWDYTMQDQAFTLKKNWESITDLVSQDSHITYFVWDTLSTFELVSKTEKEFYTDDNQQLYERNSTTSISREFNTIHFGDDNDIRIIKSESVIDPNNFISYTSKKAFWPQPNSQIDKDCYYNIYSTDELKTSSLSGAIKSHQQIEYYDDPESEFLGLKKKVTSFPYLRPVVTDFEYYSNTDSVYRYLLKKMTHSNGITKSFQYPKVYPGTGDENEGFWSIQDTQIVRIVSDQLVEKDSMIILSMYDNCMIWDPIRIVTTDNNDNSFSSLQVQNSDREIIYSTDMQNILSSFQYDEKSRLAQAVLPGNFCFDPFSAYDSSLVTANLSVNVSRYIYNSITYNCSTFTNSFTTIPTAIELYSRINVTEEVPHDDRPTEIIKVDSETDEGIGGGGGGGGSVCNEDTRYFLMFADKIELKNAVVIQNATFNIKTGIHNAPAGQTLVFSIKGVTDSLGTNQTVGSIDVSFVDNTTLQINVAPILEQIMNENKDLYGFLLSCTARWLDENNRYKQLDFDIISCLPNLVSKITRYDLYSKNFTFKYFYDDENRIIDLNVRQGSGSLTNSILSFKSEFDPFGNVLYSKTKNSLQQYETKNSSLYNSYKLNYKSLDGENRPILTRYDYLSRPIEIRLDNNWGTGSYKKIEYLSTLDGTKLPVEQIIDEENKITKMYFDRVGNLKKEERVNGSTSLITLYGYDDLNRLISVETPGHKITSYQYDDHSNISQKSSPDEGTTKYKYDKYDNLRFSINTGNSVALTFNKYDNFNRLILTGEYTFTNSFDLLNPDLDYSTNQGSIWAFENYTSNRGNFVLVNMYDKYPMTGVFADLPQAFADSLTNLKGKLVATAFRDKTSNSWSYKLYSYDHLGRVKDEYVFFQSTSAYKKISNEYDNLGNLTKQNLNNQFYTWYSYDEQARLKEVRSNMRNAYTTAKLEAVYDYDKSDKVLSAKYGTYGNWAPKVLYTYDVKGRVSNIYGMALDVFTTVFQQTLTYYNNDNIHTMFLRNDGNGSWPNLNFTYSYDNYNRLTSAACSNSYYTENYAYDYDGNLTHKTRPNNTSQSLTYNYTQPGKNYLMSLTKGLTSSNFTYDYKGNMLTDTRKLITGISYDRRNLPVSVNKSSVYYLYNYDDAGQRIYKQTSSTTKEYYLRDHTGKELAVYDWYTGKLKMLNLYGNGLFGKVNVSYNLQNARTDSRYYYIKDYLGSIRMTIDEKTFDVVSAQDYFPFGGIMENRSYTTGGNVNDKYKFTEKERDSETNLDYFGARYYDSELGIWRSVDPLWEKYYGWFPYNYCLDNPLKFIDPKGMEAVDVYPDDPDDDKEERQEKTINYLHKVGNYIEEGTKIIVEGASNIVNEVSNNLIENGPQTLNDASTAITVTGYSAGVITTFTATPLAGAGVIAATNLITAPLDLTAGGLQIIKTIKNPSSENWTDLGVSALQIYAGYKIGSGLYKGIRSLNYIKIQYPSISTGGIFGF